MANIQANIAKVSNRVKRLEENGKRLKAMQHLAEGAKARLQTLAENNQATRTDFDQRIKSRVDNKPSSLLTDSTKATGDIKAPLPVENAAMSSVFSAAPISVKRKGARVVVTSSQTPQTSLSSKTHASRKTSQKMARSTFSPRKNPTIADRPIPNYMKPTKSILAKMVNSSQQSLHPR
ncbi:hypothetical protein JZM24_03140 [Candidatus Sodalis endolongispinus]|uniref:Uncharacterized protein n=1 Tax=Candidatus Sodalis endolongispinus TaxID=2812662 RepID=A0ABS5Y8T6_9GAMM|nr:hypothetical protein [Candidatus Sodalis endolongispinus]MBT9431398.1 hypothetical protein [Candidatus Sodalis endolongispinus]